MRQEIAGPGSSSRAQRTFTLTGRVLEMLHLDGPLLAAVLAVCAAGLIVLYSAAGENVGIFLGQAARVGLGLGVLVVVAQIPPRLMRAGAPWLFALGVMLLVAVAVVGDVSMGAQRWLDLKVVRFQPSEIMKLAVPLACAWYLHDRPLPPDLRTVVVVGVAVLVPTLLIAEQPDLGTALLVASGGALVVLLAGLQLRYIFGLGALVLAAVPVAWHFMHDYQRQRVLTFLDPQNDPLGAGYHTIQSQIAIGSGGLFGKGYMNGSQAQLEFLPERSTDFIFAVIGEEWGLVGLGVLMALYMMVIARGLYIAVQAQDTFSRLMAGALTLTFTVYVFVNSGMVAGLLPVVGVAVLVPTLLIAEQPDLGTALLVASGGALVVLLAGLQLRYIFGLGALVRAAVPVAWHFMHDYQRQRVLTFLDPQNDPLGAGYHTIQSQIAIGSGGLFGKGYMNGSQAQLEFLPERSTDFIFAVIGEEWGLVGLGVLMVLYLMVIARGLYIAVQAQDTFSRLMAGALTLTFTVYVFVNSGMVAGLLPVVGVPLPLVSYGGTSLVTLMAGFGILMSIHSRRKLVST